MEFPVELAELEDAGVLRSQRREWRIERVGWSLMGVVLAVGLLGLLGNGPLARASRAAGQLTLEFDRIVRRASVTELRIRVAPQAFRDGRIQLWIDRDYLRSVHIRNIEPGPIRSASSESRLTYTFAEPPDHGIGLVVFQLEHERFGSTSGEIGVESERGLTFEQLVLP